MKLYNILAISLTVFGAAIRINAQLDICVDIAASIGILSVFLPGTLQYTSDVLHWLETSAQEATCSVRPSTADEVATVVRNSALHFLFSAVNFSRYVARSARIDKHPLCSE